MWTPVLLEIWSRMVSSTNMALHVHIASAVLLGCSSKESTSCTAVLQDRGWQKAYARTSAMSSSAGVPRQDEREDGDGDGGGVERSQHKVSRNSEVHTTQTLPSESGMHVSSL